MDTIGPVLVQLNLENSLVTTNSSDLILIPIPAVARDLIMRCADEFKALLPGKG
jgi:hypothetical protein